MGLFFIFALYSERLQSECSASSSLKCSDITESWGSQSISSRARASCFIKCPEGERMEKGHYCFKSFLTNLLHLKASDITYTVCCLSVSQ